MNPEAEKFYSLVPNYDALREEEKKYYQKPTEKEISRFLDFWQEVYNIWRKDNSPLELKYIEDKIRVRRSLIEKFGIKT